MFGCAGGRQVLACNYVALAGCWLVIMRDPLLTPHPLLCPSLPFLSHKQTYYSKFRSSQSLTKQKEKSMLLVILKADADT